MSEPTDFEPDLRQELEARGWLYLKEFNQPDAKIEAWRERAPYQVAAARLSDGLVARASSSRELLARIDAVNAAAEAPRPEGVPRWVPEGLGYKRDEGMQWPEPAAAEPPAPARAAAGRTPRKAPMPGEHVAFLPLTLDTPKVCGACGYPGPEAFLGEVRWARVDLSAEAVNGGKWDFQAVLYVPLHEHLCNDTAGGLQALKRLGVLLSNPQRAGGSRSRSQCRTQGGAMGSRDALTRRRPCLGMSDSCDCELCRARRRRRVEEAAAVEARPKAPKQLALALSLDQELAPFINPPPAEAVPALPRPPGERGWAEVWGALAKAEEAEKEAMAAARRVASRCGFRFSSRRHRGTGPRVLSAQPVCPHLAVRLGEGTVLSAPSARVLWLKMEEAFLHALTMEKQELAALALQCGFALTEAAPRKGFRGSWTACTLEGDVPLCATTPADLRRFMLEAANAEEAMQVERPGPDEHEELAGADPDDEPHPNEQPGAPEQLDAGAMHEQAAATAVEQLAGEDLVPAHCAARAPAGPEGPEVLDESHLIVMEEQPARFCELCMMTKPGTAYSETRCAWLCPGHFPVEELLLGVTEPAPALVGVAA